MKKKLVLLLGLLGTGMGFLAYKAYKEEQERIELLEELLYFIDASAFVTLSVEEIEASLEDARKELEKLQHTDITLH